jgi:hypothetical protein
MLDPRGAYEHMSPPAISRRVGDNADLVLCLSKLHDLLTHSLGDCFSPRRSAKLSE